MPKKKVSSSKKLRRQHDVRPKAPPPPPQRATFTAAQLAAAAEQALNTGEGDPWQAIALYDAALKLCQDDADTAIDTATHILEKRAEVKVSVADQDGARADYQQALQLLLLKKQSQQQPQSSLNESSNQMEEDDKDNDKTSSITNVQDPVLLERIASLYLYMGQLSQGSDALKCYQDGIQALQTSLQRREQEEKLQTMNTSTTDKDNDKSPRSSSSSSNAAIAETRQQLSAACCSAAEVYLTDLCMEDNAEQECESLIQQALLQYTDDVDGQPTTDALQTAASLRLSQCRGTEAVDIILRCYSKIQPGCCALAALVGIFGENDHHEEDDKKPPVTAAASQNDASTTAASRELTNVEAVQSLPGFEFRCQTAKILLECAAFLKEQQEQRQEGEKTMTKQSSTPTPTTTTPTTQPGGNDDNTATMKRCARAAINVLASLLAENDEVIEIWFLLGDAYAALSNNNKDDDNGDSNNNNMELAQHYWTRTLEMLQTVKDSLEQESMEATTSSQEEEDDIQQQLDEILCQMGDVRCKLNEIGDDTTLTDDDEANNKSPEQQEADDSNMEE